jgi:hypothetical protein
MNFTIFKLIDLSNNNIYIHHTNKNIEEELKTMLKKFFTYVSKNKSKYMPYFEILKNDNYDIKVIDNFEDTFYNMNKIKIKHIIKTPKCINMNEKIELIDIPISMILKIEDFKNSQSEKYKEYYNINKNKFIEYYNTNKDHIIKKQCQYYMDKHDEKLKYSKEYYLKKKSTIIKNV